MRRSLRRCRPDWDRFPIETPEIRQPDAMVVSGDIVSGAWLGQRDYENVLKGQYEIAHEFLAALTDRFFDGDRARVVMVPGNHDCCWNTAVSGMTPVGAGEEPEDLLLKLESPNTEFRWNWRERQLYRISDPDRYARRLESYWKFVDGFYGRLQAEAPNSTE